MITPIQPVYHAQNPPQRRALMSVRYDRHTVTDTTTGERFDLDAIKAWEKFNELNGIIV